MLSGTGSTVDTCFAHIFHVKMDSAQPFIAAIITTVIHYCIGGLVCDVHQQSCVRIPCQLQACCGR